MLLVNRQSTALSLWCEKQRFAKSIQFLLLRKDSGSFLVPFDLLKYLKMADLMDSMLG